MNWGDPRLPERFWNKVMPEPNSGCWLWIGSTEGGGYGNVRFNGPTRKAHRVSFEMLVGEIPDGLELDHLCRVRCCVNPLHLEPVTHAENVRRGESGLRQSNRTHCPSGHAYEGDNLKIVGGERYCVECLRRHGRTHWRKKNPNPRPVGRPRKEPPPPKQLTPRGEAIRRAWALRRERYGVTGNDSVTSEQLQERSRRAWETRRKKIAS